MAVNVILQAILRANVSQFVQGLQQAGQSVQGLGQAAQAIQTAFDSVMLLKFLEVLMQVVGGVAEFAQKTVEASAEWESLKYSMATVILASNEITDTTGKTLDQNEKYNRSLALSANLMKQLRLDAAVNVGTTKDLVGAYIGLSNAVSNTSKHGENAIQKTRNLSNSLVAASFILGKAVLKGGTDQAVRETNELLEGRLTRINTFARALGIIQDKAGYKAAVKEGKVYEYLMTKLSAYNTAQEKISRTYQGLKSTLEDIQDLSMQTIGQLIFEKVKSSFGDMVDTFFVRGKDGVLALNDSFLKVLDTLSVLMDSAMSPFLKLIQEIVSDVQSHSPDIMATLRVFADSLGLIGDLLKLAYDMLKLSLDIITGGSIRQVLDLTDGVVVGLRDIITWLDNIVNWIDKYVVESMKHVWDTYDQYIAPIFKALNDTMGFNSDLTKKKAEDDKQAGLAAKTHASAIGDMNSALDENSKKVKDNTQHWKNWVATLQAAFQNRVPELASSFLTSFGNGSLGPNAAGTRGSYTINLVGPNGQSAQMTTHMTPQQVAQFHSTAKTWSGSMQKSRQTMNFNPASRPGPIQQ